MTEYDVAAVNIQAIGNSVWVLQATTLVDLIIYDKTCHGVLVV